jgi:hypothetical protein
MSVTEDDRLAELAAELAELRVELATLLRIAALFYEAGRSDALGIPARPLRVIRLPAMT